MRRAVILFVAAVLILSIFAVPSGWAKDKLVMGVHPYKPVSELYAMFKPIADHVSKQLGKPVELRIGKTYAETVELIGKGEVDLAFIGPSLYVEGKSRYNSMIGKPLV